MASIGSACRLSARIANRQLRHHASKRGFRAVAANKAAHNFAMPALSPTMTEGNIASWKLKEGDTFSAGDVILEIETDKATMDVEAQDDGILAKIIQGDGSKSVQVGTRIAVLAEPGDDISSLEIPAEDSASKAKPEPAEASKAEQPPAAAPQSSSTSSAGSKAAGKATKQTYPLYPSVLQLLKENGMGKEDADKIPASGPSGRLLKGDVLAFLGKIESSYSATQSARIAKLGHLDLSNIKIAAPPAKPAPAASAPAAAAAPEAEPDTEIALPISFSAVLECQQRIQETLGIFLPVATFVARAIELANEDLPASAAARSKAATADDLFNAVLGLPPATPTFSRGAFMPEITALAATQLPPARQAIVKAKPADVYDVLTGAKSRVAGPLELPMTKHMKGAVNVFSVVAPKGDEKRAVVFLERVKTVLEAEPGRLVL